MSKLEIYRREKGLTYRQLACLTGTSRSTIHRICRDKTKRIALELAVRITNTTPLTVEELL